jgi:hypothetical protein
MYKVGSFHTSLQPLIYKARMTPPTAMAIPANPPWAPTLNPAFPVSVAEATADEAAEARLETDPEAEEAPDWIELIAEEAELRAEETVADAAEAAEERVEPAAAVALLVSWLRTKQWEQLTKLGQKYQKQLRRKLQRQPRKHQKKGKKRRNYHQLSPLLKRTTYPAADSPDSAAEAAEEVAPTTAPETEEAAFPSSVVVVMGELESVSSEETAEEVAVAAGASPAAVLGVWTAAWAHTPSAAETAPSTSSGFYQSLIHSSRRGTHSTGGS